MPERPLPTLRLRKLWLTLGYLFAAIITVLSLYPFAPIESLPKWTDKVEHGLTHLALAGWFLQIYHGRRNWLMVSLACLAFGGAIELAQMATPTRSAEWLDLAADAGGILAAGALVAATPLRFGLTRISHRLA